MLREDTQFIFTPILIITALDDTDSKIVAFGAGADNYMIKPYDVDELAETIKLMLTGENE
jgi:DNA-binding response OmpR family regulator